MCVVTSAMLRSSAYFSQDERLVLGERLASGGGGSQSVGEPERVDQSSAGPDWHQEDVWRGRLRVLRGGGLLRGLGHWEEEDYRHQLCKHVIKCQDALFRTLICMYV